MALDQLRQVLRSLIKEQLSITEIQVYVPPEPAKVELTWLHTALSLAVLMIIGLFFIIFLLCKEIKEISTHTDVICVQSKDSIVSHVTKYLFGKKNDAKPAAMIYSEDKFVLDDGKKFKVARMKGDGNCLYRCMAHYVLKDVGKHEFMRHEITSYISSNFQNFAPFLHYLTPQEYQAEMKQEGSYGGEPEVFAFAEMFGVKVHIVKASERRWNPLVYGSSIINLFMLYSGKWDSGHYDVLIPSTNKLMDPKLYKEGINLLRDAALVIFKAQIEAFKKKKKKKNCKA